jgi:hypothetical protein
MAAFRPYRLERKEREVMPIICPQDMIELQPLNIGEASAGDPSADVSVAKRATNPLFAIILALILGSVSERPCVPSGKLNEPNLVSISSRAESHGHADQCAKLECLDRLENTELLVTGHRLAAGCRIDGGLVLDGVVIVAGFDVLDALRLFCRTCVHFNAVK